jgi:hypothetical protein
MDEKVSSRSRWRLGVDGVIAIMFLALAIVLSPTLGSSAQAATAAVGLGNASSFSVLGASTVTNTGPTSMSGDLGLSPGTSVTGAPAVGGTTHVADAVAVAAQNSLSTAYSDAAGRPSTVLASADLSGQTFTTGVYKAPSSLLLSAGSVTLNAQGDPNAVFIFQIGSTLTTGSATTILLTNGAQPCNVFWQVGSSATLGTGSRFIGSVMAQASITAKTSTTLDGRLLARTGAVNLDTNTITTSACAAGTTNVNPVATQTSPLVPGAPTSTTTTPTGSTPATTAPSGTARLSGPRGPVSGPFAVTVTGHAIESVTFYLDGRRIGSVHAKRGRTKFRITINPRGQSHRVHRIKARVRFTPASGTPTTTRRITYRRTQTPPPSPQFTG